MCVSATGSHADRRGVLGLNTSPAQYRAGSRRGPGARRFTHGGTLFRADVVGDVAALRGRNTKAAAISSNYVPLALPVLTPEATIAGIGTRSSVSTA